MRTESMASTKTNRRVDDAALACVSHRNFRMISKSRLDSDESQIHPVSKNKLQAVQEIPLIN